MKALINMVLCGFKASLNNKLNGCSLEQNGKDFYIVGADSVRKKLGSQNMVINFTGSQGFTWGSNMQLSIAEYNTLSVSGRFTVDGGAFVFSADGVTLINIDSEKTPNVNFSRNISAYKNLAVGIGTASFVGTMTLSV